VTDRLGFYLQDRIALFQMQLLVGGRFDLEQELKQSPLRLTRLVEENPENDAFSPKSV